MIECNAGGATQRLPKRGTLVQRYTNIPRNEHDQMTHAHTHAKADNHTMVPTNKRMVSMTATLRGPAWVGVMSNEGHEHTHAPRTPSPLVYYLHATRSVDVGVNAGAQSVPHTSPKLDEQQLQGDLIACRTNCCGMTCACYTVQEKKEKGGCACIS